MKNDSHIIDLIIDGKKIRTSGKELIFRLDGTLVLDSTIFEKDKKISANEFDNKTINFLLKAADGAFGHPERFRILVGCADNPKSFNEIKRAFAISSPTLTYHLKRLTGSWLLFKNDEGVYSPTLLGLLILNYFSDFLKEASRLNKQLSQGLSISGNKNAKISH